MILPSNSFLLKQFKLDFFKRQWGRINTVKEGPKSLGARNMF